jgi:hypothetical protein
VTGQISGAPPIVAGRRIHNVLREPLVHFLLIGAAIFGLFNLMNGSEEAGAQARITIPRAEVEQLASIWGQRWKRQPTEEELAGLIEERVREEVYYREALALGLDRNDVQIRRLMQKKLEFITENVVVPPEPSVADLAAYYEANADRYSRPSLLSFTQIYFAADRRGGSADKDARAVLARLNGGLDEAAAFAQGDGQLFPDTLLDQTARDIEAVFGPEFAASVAGIAPGAWVGPVASAYGLHLVRIDARRIGALRPYDEVADKVQADWTYEQIEKAGNALYQSLRDRYEVIVEPGALPQSDGLGQS